jgi:hypothetical protein
MIFETYQLNINETETGKSITMIPKNLSNVEALKEVSRKIYIVCNDKTILYVGEADTSVKLRLQRGSYAYNYFKKHGKSLNGYKGYKWLDDARNEIQSLSLHVIIFNSSYDDNRAEIEAIEGELVYEIRNQTGSWPECQNEIHFSNVVDANSKAQQILKEFML